MTEPVQENITPDLEAKAVALFYRTVLDELHDTALAHDLTMAYVSTFARRLA